MSFRFNSGRGGVTCDMCNALFDADLGLKEYEMIYGRGNTDLCWKCKEKLNAAQNKNNSVSGVRQGLRDKVKSAL